MVCGNRRRSGGEGEQRVAVLESVGWIDRAGHTIVAHFGDLGHLRFVESRIRCNHADSRVLPRLRILGHTSAGPVGFHNVEEGLSVRCARAGDNLAGFWINNVTNAIHRNNCPDHDPIRQPNTRSTDAAFHPLSTVELSNGCARTSPNTAFFEGTGLCVHRCPIAGVRIGTNPAVTHIEVKKDRRRHDRDFPAGECVSVPVFFQIAGNTGCRIQPECAAAREHDRVHLVDAVGRFEQIGFVRSRR